MIDKTTLHAIMHSVAAEDTAYGAEFIPGTLINHCGAVAYTVQQLYGGYIVGATINGTRHIWNQLPNGLQVDLSSCQYQGNGLTPLTVGKLLPPRKTVNPRFQLFFDRISLFLL